MATIVGVKTAWTKTIYRLKKMGVSDYPKPLTIFDFYDTLFSPSFGWHYYWETDIDTRVVYGLVSSQSETPQQIRVYISGSSPVNVWLNATMVYGNIGLMPGIGYITAVPVMLNAGENLLFIAAYQDTINRQWGASFGFQNGTIYTTQSP